FVIGKSTGINGGTRLQHVGGPFGCPGRVHGRIRRKIAGNLFAFLNNIVVQFRFGSAGILQSGYVGILVVFKNLVPYNGHTAQPLDRIKVCPGAQETRWPYIGKFVFLSDYGRFPESLKELVDISYQTVGMDTPAVVIVTLNIVGTAV